MGELDRAKAQIDADDKERRRGYEQAYKDAKENLRSLNAAWDKLGKQVVAHADSCAVCAPVYLKSNRDRLAVDQCAQAAEITAQADALGNDIDAAGKTLDQAERQRPVGWS